MANQCKNWLNKLITFKCTVSNGYNNIKTSNDIFIIWKDRYDIVQLMIIIRKKSSELIDSLQ